MIPTNVYIETGKKKTFASAVDWPGWSRSGRDEDQALQVLVDYGPRYAQVLKSGGINFQPPSEPSQLIILERYAGNATTDFGSPAIIPDADRQPFDQHIFEHSQIVLQACWAAFDRATKTAAGKELRKGPRGGGRDLDKIVQHVVEADQAYLKRITYKQKLESGLDAAGQLVRIRQAIVDALQAASVEPLPERGPRGGVIWPVRYFVRRSAWHVLDHTWEIEDRIE
ncbi:MAG: hypothetical protein ACK2UM_04030 [Anaerolineales bacterium]